MATEFAQLMKFGPLMYVPTVLHGLGQSALIPILPVLAQQLGADIVGAGVVASAMVVGQVCGNIPASWAVSRFGERRTMGVAAMLSIIGTIGVGLAGSVILLTCSAFFIGLCSSAFALARHAFMTSNVPPRIRGRALSMLGGTYRLGYAIGPFAAAAILLLSAQPRLVAALFAVCLAIIVVLLRWAREPSPMDVTGEDVHAMRSVTAQEAPDRREPLVRLLWRYRALFGTLGIACSVLTAVRQVRLMVLPLWGISIGVAIETITVVVGVAGVVDFALFYVGGQIVDRFGRRWVAVPSTILIGGAMVALAFTHDLGSSQTWFVVLAIVLGIGNGIGSGIVITLASDAAPRSDPAPFLGAWRLLTDAGGAAGPVALSALAVISLPIAVGVVGAIALVDAVGLGVLIPKRSQQQ